MLTATRSEATPAPLRVLLVGSREEDFFLIREILKRSQNALAAHLDHAHSLDEARALSREHKYGLFLLQHDAGDGITTELLAEFAHSEHAVPFILLTEHADETTVAEIIKIGAWDCLERSQLNGLTLMRTIRSILNLHSMQQGWQSAEESLRKLYHAVEQSADMVMITGREGLIEYVNPAFEVLNGYSRNDVIGKTPRILKSGEHAADIYRDLWRTVLSGSVYRGILVNRKKNGELYYAETIISPVRDGDGRITHFISNGRDLTERMRLEAQLLQSQKMDAIGRLAGGVAHDFNNLLTIITSYSELALDAIVPGSALESKVREILAAARRAAELTRQLLAFSRKQVQSLRIVDLNQVTSAIATTLRRLISEDIELTFVPGADLGQVRADPMQIEQVLMNLAVNACDAMPQGGILTIETSHIFLDDDYVRGKHAIIPTGHYALLTVSDNGVGIPKDHLPHIFEPFYTTKPSGKGTGLGLATVYGIVKQNRGFIWTYSEAGLGTVFKIYLPCIRHGRPASESTPDALPPDAVSILHGNETILLVEDEDALRRATAEFLALCGYTVLEAKNGIDALAVAKAHGATIHLVISDVVMLHMSGGQLAEELEAVRPETKVLFVSGYAGKTIVDHKVVHLNSNFLQKPFTLKQLSLKVREVLAGKAEAVGV
jgi:two-component system, cell cycle sensor histidine kinase and response regulator CckA